MHVLVTGACGYKGTVLVPKLLMAGHRVTGVDIMWFGNFLRPHPELEVIEADVRNIDSVPLDGVDAIIHLSSIANDPCGDLDPKLTWETSVLTTMQLADRAVRRGIKRFIYASSGSVYGVKDDPEVTEDLELVPISEYNKTKMCAERVLLSYRDDLLVQIVRPATVCGFSPRMRLDVSVNMLTMQALTAGRITVFGGEQTRPNIHMDDITDLYSSCSTIRSISASTMPASRTCRSSTSPAWCRATFRRRSSLRRRTIRAPIESTPTGCWRPASGRRRPSRMRSSSLPACIARGRSRTRTASII